MGSIQPSPNHNNDSTCPDNGKTSSYAAKQAVNASAKPHQRILSTPKIHALNSQAFQLTKRLLNVAFPKLEPFQQAQLDGSWSPDICTDYCQRCGGSVGPHAYTAAGCGQCLGHKITWDSLTRLGEYEAPLSNWIKDAKYHHQWSICRWLGQQLAQAWAQIHLNHSFLNTTQPTHSTESNSLWVTHVPMHWTRRWARSYDQADLIAHAFAQSLQRHAHKPTHDNNLDHNKASESGTIQDGTIQHVPLLTRPKRTRKQSRVDLDHRTRNVRDGFSIAKVDLTGQTVILIDDIKTTGATLKQCVKQLRKRGAETIHVAVAAVA